MEQSAKVCYSSAMRRLLFLFAAFCIMLISCRSAKIEKDENGTNLNSVVLTDHAHFTLLPTSAIEKNVDTVQHFKARFSDKEFEAECLLIADETRLSMTIMNSFGSTIGELNYNNDLIVFNSELFPKVIPPAYIVVDIQFCLYRADSLEAELKSSGLEFHVSAPDPKNGSEKEIRSILDGDREIIHIERTGGTITFQNLLRGYSYELQGEF